MLSTLWKTCKWLFLICLVIFLGAGGYGFYLWKHSDKLLHQAFVDVVHSWAPDLKVELGRVAVDWFGHVHVEDLSLTLPGEPRPLISLGNCVVDLDRDAFLERQEVIVQKVRLIRPETNLIRYDDGTWNWQKLPPLPETKKGALPSCLVENAQIVVQLSMPNSQAGVVTLKNVGVVLTPTAKRSMQIESKLEVDRLGRLSLDGKVNVDAQTGAVTGTLKGLKVDRSLLEYVGAFEPKVLQAVAGIEQKLRDEMFGEPDPKASSPFSIRGIARSDWVDPSKAHLATAHADSGKLIPVAATTVVPNAVAHSIPVENLGGEHSILGLNLDLNLGFEFSRANADEMPIGKLICEIVGGEVTNTALAFPIQNLAGRVELGDGLLTIHQLTGNNGPTELDIRGSVSQEPSGPTGRLGVKLKNIACDERLRRRLSVGFGKIYDANHLQGFLDMEAVIASDDSGKWKPESFTVSANHCSAMHDVFPYRVQDAVGTIKQVGTDLVIDLQGYAGRQPITLEGRVRNPGPDAWIQLDITVNDLPIDDNFIAACPLGLRKVIASMSLKGLVDGKWHLEKKPGVGQPFVPSLNGTLHDGSMLYSAFPYRVNELGGKLTFDGKTWTFKDLNGMHGGARLKAFGKYSKVSGVGDLDLTVVTQDAPIDETLYQAVPQSLKSLWPEFQPSGLIRHVETHVRWIENQPVVVALPRLEVTKAGCLIRRFPYELADIEASFEYVPGVPKKAPAQLKIKAFEGRHADALFVINPGERSSVTLGENGDWKVRLQTLSVRNLHPNQDLRRAVSPGLKTVLAAMNPEQPVDLEGMLELKGTADARYPMTAAWSIKADLAGNQIEAGLTLDDVHGSIESTGTWDGAVAVIDGELNLATLKVFEKYELTEIAGPFRYRNGILSGGSLLALEGRQESQADQERQVTAQFADGLLNLSATTTTDEQPQYHVRLNFSHGQLQTFAQRYLANRDKLRGTIHGWLNVNGQGSTRKAIVGTGQIQISPAALYEVPIIVQLLTALNPQASNSAAFNYALINFRINQARFAFDAIDLVGDSMQLRGRGEATFDGDIRLRFYSMLPYSMLPKTQLPVWVPVVTEVGNLVRNATREATKGWVVIEVNGKVDNPETQLVPAGNFKGILNNLQPLPSQPVRSN